MYACRGRRPRRPVNDNYRYPSTSLQDASGYLWILPRPKKVSPGHFFTPPAVGSASSNPIIHPMQKPSAKAEGLHGKAIISWYNAQPYSRMHHLFLQSFSGIIRTKNKFHRIASFMVTIYLLDYCPNTPSAYPFSDFTVSRLAFVYTNLYNIFNYNL